MFKNPIIEELRKIRKEIERSAVTILKNISSIFKKLQESYKYCLIARKPKPALKLAKTG